MSEHKPLGRRNRAELIQECLRLRQKCLALNESLEWAIRESHIRHCPNPKDANGGCDEDVSSDTCILCTARYYKEQTKNKYKGVISDE